jgi:hypothetical protein
MTENTDLDTNTVVPAAPPEKRPAPRYFAPAKRRAPTSPAVAAKNPPPVATESEPVDDEPQEVADDLQDVDPDDYAAAAAQLAQEAVEGLDDAEEGEPASQREAKYRVRLRDAESERDAAVAKIETQHLELDALRSVEVLRLAGAVLIDARDLMPDGSDLSALLNADGTVSPEKVNALANRVIADRPHYGRAGIQRHNGALTSGAQSGEVTPPTTWKTAFEPTSG